MQFVLWFGLALLVLSPYLMKSNEPRQIKRQIAATRNQTVTLNRATATSQTSIAREPTIVKVTKPMMAKPERNTIEEIRSKLDPETLAWSEKFPRPRNDREDEVLTRLQMAYKLRGNSTMLGLVPEKDIGWRKLDRSIDDYIEQCLLRLDSHNEMDMKNYLFWLSYRQRPETDIRSAVAQQLEIYFEDPSRYDERDYMDLKAIIEVPSMFDAETQDIALEMARVREQ